MLSSGVFSSFIFAIFIGALSSSVSHCVGMCGGIAICINMRKLGTASLYRRVFLNFLYFFGRLNGYMLVGVTAFMLKLSITTSLPVVHGMMYIAIGISIIITSFLFAFMPKYLRLITPSGQYAWYRRVFSYMLLKDNTYSFYFLGLLNGLLPCGLVYTYVLMSISAESIEQAMAIMLAFGIATFFGLFIVGLGGSILFNFRLRNLLLVFGFFISLYLGANNVYNGVIVLQDGTHQVHHH